MNCDDARSRFAHDEAEALAHATTCAACRAEADEIAALETELRACAIDDAATAMPSTDADQLLAVAASSRPSRLTLTSLRTLAPLRTLGRVAAVVLAAFGALALLKTDVRTDAGHVHVSFRLWTAPPTAVVAKSSDATELRGALREELRPVLTGLSDWMTADRRQRELAWSELLTLVEHERSDDLGAVARELAALRQDLDVTRDMQAAMAGMGPDMPRLPEVD